MKMTIVLSREAIDNLIEKYIRNQLNKKNISKLTIQTEEDACFNLSSTIEFEVKDNE